MSTLDCARGSALPQLPWQFGTEPKPEGIRADFWDEIPEIPAPGVSQQDQSDPLQYFYSGIYISTGERADHESDLLLTSEAVLGSTGDEKRNLPKI